MSIINDAIRKSRRDNRDSSRFGDDPLPPRQPSRGHDPGQLIVLLVATALIASVSVGLGVFVILQFTDRDATPAPAASLPSANTPARALQPVEDTSLTTTASPSGDPAAALTTEAQPTEIEPLSGSGNEKEQVMQASISYIQGLPVSGVRISDAGRIAMIGRSVYREGEVINAALGLSLRSVQPDFLLFEDRFGNRYRRRL